MLLKCSFMCMLLQSELGVVPLVSLVNEYQQQPLHSLGGSAVALASRSDLQTLQDIRDQRVSLCQLQCIALQWRHQHTSSVHMHAVTVAERRFVS